VAHFPIIIIKEQFFLQQLPLQQLTFVIIKQLLLLLQQLFKYAHHFRQQLDFHELLFQLFLSFLMHLLLFFRLFMMVSFFPMVFLFKIEIQLLLLLQLLN
jgi:hypothetical protein